MSYLVCRMQKFTRTNVFGLQKHNQRENENYKNKDIDPERTNLNYDLQNDNSINHLKKVDEIIHEHRTSDKAVRKDAIVYVDTVVTSDREYFKGLSEPERDRFFKESYNYLSEKVGKENVVGSIVHLDETTPHMHFSFVPMTEGSLSAKKLINRNFLRSLQDEFPKHMQEKGFNVERGRENSEEKHKTIVELKRDTYEKVGKELDNSINAIKSDLKHVSAFDDVKLDKVPLPFMKGKIAVSKDQYEDNLNMGKLGKVTLRQNEKLKTEVEQLKEDREYEVRRAVGKVKEEYEPKLQELKNENQHLKSNNDFYHKRNMELSSKVTKLSKENKSLSNELKIRDKALDKTLSKISNEKAREGFKSELDKNVKAIVKSLTQGLER